MFEPKLPPVEKMPRKRVETPPSYAARGVALCAGIALGVSSAMGIYRAFSDSSGQQSPFMALALLLPTVILVRYALTGQIKA